MTAKSFLLLLGAASAFANQIPIGVGSVCLSSATPNDCCTSGAPTPTGEVTIDDRTFKFTCGSALGSLNPKTAQKVSNAHECASLCADDLSCEASSFKAHGKPPRGNNCFFVLGDNLDQRSDEEWITFTETSKKTRLLLQAGGQCPRMCFALRVRGLRGNFLQNTG
ncbi:hypothetical protein DTO012A8_8555 [Penicillium roqueforti]|nr:hypothetical protein DTO012A8_8555 [Penicillium roqueforti]